jgi:hypothetical protein
MPQDFTVDANDQQIDPDRLAALRQYAKDRGEVSPYDYTTVYATQKLADANTINSINKAGYALRVHVALAEKLIASGKATKDAPKEEKESKSK